MAKSTNILHLSFSASGYEKFVSLTKDKQIEKLQQNGSFVSDKQAEKALKGVPNGDISSRVDKESEGNKPTGSASTGSDISGKGSKSSAEKGKD